MKKSMAAGVMASMVLWLASMGPGSARPNSAEPAEKSYRADVVIYGGTSAGVAAAVQSARMGRKALIIAQGSRLGGLTTGGLGATDIGNKQVIGGISREFYRRIARKYSQPGAWKWQTREEYFAEKSQTSPGESTMGTFEPKVALEVFQEMIRENNISILYGQRLALKQGVRKEEDRILSITMESGMNISGKVFIDASYEGDLMATAGVSYATGREANSVYGETLSGVQSKRGIYHQFPNGVDPYRKKGDPAGGLLPHLNPNLAQEGSGDIRIQAYCFRMCLTDVAENRIPFEKPAGYEEQEYELLFRAIEAGLNKGMITLSAMPNRKTDSNNNGPFSTDFIGMNYEYPDGDYRTREKIEKAHLVYQQGLMWTLANHPRIPEKIRAEYSRWGLPRDEFTESGNWTPQLYIREARRMIGNLVMTEHHCTQVRITAPESVGMGAYTMDSHHVQRHVDREGFVKNEGDVEVGGFKPYPIGLKAILPKKEECANLIVPVCLSASHMAYGSIRMEPVFMVLGQSAATVAVLSLEKGKSVHEVPYEEIEKRLKTDGQILGIPR